MSKPLLATSLIFHEIWWNDLVSVCLVGVIAVFYIGLFPGFAVGMKFTAHGILFMLERRRSSDSETIFSRGAN